MSAMYDINLEEFEEVKYIGEEIAQWECKKCHNIYNIHLPFQCDCHNKTFGVYDFTETTIFFEKNPECFKQEAKKMLKAEMRNEVTEIITINFQKQNKTYTTRFDERNEMYCYQNGIYVAEGRSKVKEFCRIYLQESYTEQLANRVIAKIEADTFIQQEELLKRHYENLIAVKNGILNLDTKEILPFTPKKIFFTKINAEYISSAICPTIETFLEQVLPEKKDMETVFEWFGYCLLGGYIFQKILLLVGEGGTGKSRVLEMLKKFLGEKAFCSIPLQKFEENDFKESELFGRYANIGADISDQPLKTTAKIKGLSGGDSISASRKFKNDLVFQNEAKLVFSANKLPKTYEISHAFFRRWVYLIFPNKFLPESEYNLLTEENISKYRKANPKIIEEILTTSELNGLLCKSLEGLDRLRKNGGFTASQTSEETKKWWIRNSDSFLAFCWEEIEDDANENIVKEELRREYKKFCRKNKLPAENNNHIKQILEREMMAIDGQEGQDRLHVWEGIRFKRKARAQQI